jgi:putative FmdB family regulatory protein
MPLYEYHCGNCNRHYEKIQSANAPRSLRCDDCGELAKRVLSVIAKPVSSSSSDSSEKPFNLGIVYPSDNPLDQLENERFAAKYAKDVYSIKVQPHSPLFRSACVN